MGDAAGQDSEALQLLGISDLALEVTALVTDPEGTDGMGDIGCQRVQQGDLVEVEGTYGNIETIA